MKTLQFGHLKLNNLKGEDMTKEEREEVIRYIINKHLKNMREALSLNGYSINSHFHWELRRLCQENNQ